MATPVISDLIENTVGKGVDALINKFLPKSMSEAEKSDARQSFIGLITQVLQASEQNITDRHKFDMQSDSWLSKNIRPFVLIWLIVSFNVFALLSIDKPIAPDYITLLSDMLKVAFGFYFGGRTVEKITKIWKGDK
jgi:hypothetical protein